MADLASHSEQQLIPTNAGGRSFAGPPKALQSNITPTDLFYVRNHWKGAPDIDPDSYRLVVDGEVARDLDLTLQQVKELPHRRYQATFECCGNGPIPGILGKADPIGDGEGDRPRHYGQRGVGRRFFVGCTQPG